MTTHEQRKCTTPWHAQLTRPPAPAARAPASVHSPLSLLQHSTPHSPTPLLHPLLSFLTNPPSLLLPNSCTGRKNHLPPPAPPHDPTPTPNRCRATAVTAPHPLPYTHNYRSSATAVQSCAASRACAAAISSRHAATCAKHGRSLGACAQHATISRTKAGGAHSGNGGRAPATMTRCMMAPGVRPRQGRSPVASSHTVRHAHAQAGARVRAARGGWRVA